MSLSRKQKKEKAQQLYTYTELTQKEIAEIVGVSEQTMCRWVKEGWDELRAANKLTLQQVVKNLYAKAMALAQDPAANADQIAKISASIDRLTRDKTTLVHYIEVFKEFDNWLLMNGFAQEAKRFAALQREFINQKL